MLESLFQGEYASILKILKENTGVTSEQLSEIAVSFIPKITDMLSGSLAGFQGSESGQNGALELTQLLSLATQIDIEELAQNPSNVLGPEVQDVGRQVLYSIFGGEAQVDEFIKTLSGELSLGVNVLEQVLPSLAAPLLALVGNPSSNSGLMGMVAGMLSQSGGIESLLSGLGISQDQADNNDSLMKITEGVLGKGFSGLKF
ncbi:MAG TPA: hypothetical protein PKA63_06725 [Oligoflexia bacterium]|nr:hypothetical protein [Oligoflexia bacterium]HMP48343.1 hypothetical protein [Oligoflexia bacterium]